VATEETLHYEGYDTPPGVYSEGNRNEWPWLTRLQYPVSQLTYFVHTDPTLFPEPYRFNPDRWVEAAQQGIPLNKYLVNSEVY